MGWNSLRKVLLSLVAAVWMTAPGLSGYQALAATAMAPKGWPGRAPIASALDQVLRALPAAVRGEAIGFLAAPAEDLPGLNEHLVAPRTAARASTSDRAEVAAFLAQADSPDDGGRAMVVRKLVALSWLATPHVPRSELMPLTEVTERARAHLSQARRREIAAFSQGIARSLGLSRQEESAPSSDPALGKVDVRGVAGATRSGLKPASGGAAEKEEEIDLPLEVQLVFSDQVARRAGLAVMVGIVLAYLALPIPGNYGGIHTLWLLGYAVTAGVLLAVFAGHGLKRFLLFHHLRRLGKPVGRLFQLSLRNAMLLMVYIALVLGAAGSFQKSEKLNMTLSQSWWAQQRLEAVERNHPIYYSRPSGTFHTPFSVFLHNMGALDREVWGAHNEGGVKLFFEEFDGRERALQPAYFIDSLKRRTKEELQAFHQRFLIVHPDVPADVSWEMIRFVADAYDHYMGLEKENERPLGDPLQTYRSFSRAVMNKYAPGRQDLEARIQQAFADPEEARSRRRRANLAAFALGALLMGANAWATRALWRKLH